MSFSVSTPQDYLQLKGNFCNLRIGNSTARPRKIGHNSRKVLLRFDIEIDFGKPNFVPNSKSFLKRNILNFDGEVGLIFNPK